MQVILLERVQSLGQLGDVVTVRPGYARNFLLPKRKALRATKDNVAYFEAQKSALESENDKKRSSAETDAGKVNGLTTAVIRQASEAGHLYGSVTKGDIAASVEKATGVKVVKTQVQLNQSFKFLGLYPVTIALHPEVLTEVTINIARSLEEAEIQEERGEALIVKKDDEDEGLKAKKLKQQEAAIAAVERQQAEAAAKAEAEKLEAEAKKAAGDAKEAAMKEA